MAIFRDYEVSVWTLQDEFITVLKPSQKETKEYLDSPEMKLNIDGTQEFTFSIPMYIYQGTERKENPVWYNTKNGVLIANLKKIKVIFNPLTDKQKIFEFLITKVEEKHSNDTLYCDVTCEGLAFHELGKIGYKVSLSSEAYYNEDYENFEKGIETQPATLQYWVNKFLQPWSNTGTHHLAQWYYSVEMDWSSYENASNRSSDKVYEDAYVSSWQIVNNKLQPRAIEEAKEKERMIDSEESNYYNLTQTIAETFGVFCRYEYEHDNSYHIIARRVIFYNNFMREKEGYINITYPYLTSEITREMDSTDSITKMYVKTVDNDASASGWSTIMNAPANKMKEDYIMNFDYLRQVGAINEEQYAAIDDYEKEMHDANDLITRTSDILLRLQEQLPEFEAKLQIAKNAIILDKEQLSKAGDLLRALDEKDGVDGVITIGENNPKSAVMLQDKNSALNGNNSEAYYIKLSEKGIIADSIKIFKKINYAAKDNESRLMDPINDFQIQYDETGLPERINNIVFETTPISKLVYITFQYKPELYYKAVEDMWANRLNKDEQDRDKYQFEVDNLKDMIDTVKGQYEDYIAQKEEKQLVFQRWFGGAIREGYWQPDNYNDYGDIYTDAFVADEQHTGSSGLTSFVWDTHLFEEEQVLEYQLSAAQKTYYYPCINLSGLNLTQNMLENLSLVFYDHEISPNQDPKNELRIFSQGSLCQYAFLKQNNNVIPVLLVNGAETLSEDALNYLKNKDGKNGHARLCIFSTTINNETDPISVVYNIENAITVAGKWIEPTAADRLVYPRIKIDSLALKTSSDQLAVKYNSTFLHDFDDYYVLSRSIIRDNDANITDNSYYVTLKPETIFLKGGMDKNVEIKFTISNADTLIYLDALQVLKENAFPKVSYTVTPSAIRKELLYDLYNDLARVVNIIDNDLKFENIQGYISEINLHLNNPQDDKVEIKNYKTKFEDLFSTIVAQTESMKKNEHIIDMAASNFVNGQLSKETIQNALRRVDLNYAFNNGTLTIDEANGIWGTSDAGVVAFRGGGIFTATEKDGEGNWIWNTGIVPQGINADLITTGQLDTNLIKIYSGDDVKFQWNGNGLYAFKSFLSDEDLMAIAAENAVIRTALKNNKIGNQDGSIGSDIDAKQYVVFNEDGLFLRAEEGALVPNAAADDVLTVGHTTDRVEISWKGLILRNWDYDANDPEKNKVFFADPDTGNLTVKGTIYARGLYIGDDEQSFDYYKNSNRNLLLNSATNIPEKYPKDSDSTLSSEIVSVDEWNCNDAIRIYGHSNTLNNTTSNPVVAIITQDSHGFSSIAARWVGGYPKYIVNQNYTWSCYIKNNSSVNNLIIQVNGFSPSIVTIPPLNVKYYSATVMKSAEEKTNLQITFIVKNDEKTTQPNYDFTFWHPKVEFGETATVWSAAPEDSQHKINGTKLSVDADTGEIVIKATNSISIGAQQTLDIFGGSVRIGSYDKVQNVFNNSIELNNQGISIKSVSDTTENAIELNSDGVSIASGGTLQINSRNFVVKMDDNNTQLTRFALGSNLQAEKIDEQDPLLDLFLENDEYKLSISGNITASLPQSLTAVASRITWTDQWTSGVPIFNTTEDGDTYPLGTIGIAYTALSGESTVDTTISGQFNKNDSNYLSTASYEIAGHGKSTKFGITSSYWNVSRGAKDTFTTDTWARAGHYDAELATCSFYVPIYLKIPNNMSNQDVTVTFNYKWRLTPAAQAKIGWSCYNGTDFSNHVWVTGNENKGLTFSLFENLNSAAISSTTKILGDTSTQANTTYSGNVSLNFNTSNLRSGTYYLLIYEAPDSNGKYKNYTLRYFDQNSFIVGNGSAIESGTIGIYIRTALGTEELWQKLITVNYPENNNNDNNNNNNNDNSENNTNSTQENVPSLEI